MNREHSFFCVSACEIMNGDKVREKCVACMQTGFGTLVPCGRKGIIIQKIGGKKEMIDSLSLTLCISLCKWIQVKFCGIIVMNEN